jgi:hypothetical protein
LDAPAADEPDRGDVGDAATRRWCPTCSSTRWWAAAAIVWLEAAPERAEKMLGFTPRRAER